MSELETKKIVFDTLNAIDCKQYIKENEGTLYLPWTKAWEIVKRTFPDASYEVERFDGKPYLADEMGVMVFTNVTIKGETMSMWLPVMNTSHKAMKVAPYEYETKYGKKRVEGANMCDINRTIMRCLTKNIAMFGLGIYIYIGEDIPEPVRVEIDSKVKEKTMLAIQDAIAATTRKDLSKVWNKWLKDYPKVCDTDGEFFSFIRERAEQIDKAEKSKK